MDPAWLFAPSVLWHKLKHNLDLTKFSISTSQEALKRKRYKLQKQGAVCNPGQLSCTQSDSHECMIHQLEWRLGWADLSSRGELHARLVQARIDSQVCLGRHEPLLTTEKHADDTFAFAIASNAMCTCPVQYMVKSPDARSVHRRLRILVICGFIKC